MYEVPLKFTLCHASDINSERKEKIPAVLPGAVQLDYARAENYGDYWYGLNYKKFGWMEDEYFFYEAVLDFTCSEGKVAFFRFSQIDYGYKISLDGKTVAEREGIYSPVIIDVTEFSGKKAKLEIILLPIPKVLGVSHNGKEAANAVKPEASYSIDWHPRLVPKGIYEEARLVIMNRDVPVSIDAEYRLSDDFSKVWISGMVHTAGEGEVTVFLTDPDGNCLGSRRLHSDKCAPFEFELEDPELWYPRTYGGQPIYKLTARGGGEETIRKIGFRKVELLPNDNIDKRFASGKTFTPLPAPMTISVNGMKIFAKGSNFVCPDIFPCETTDGHYDEIVSAAYRANMNMLRVWGGQYVPREHFYDKCDELGIMVWQEFTLSCNKYPDDDGYLGVLEHEATTLIKRLRSHPSLMLWCGGNELFNTWSRMTLQAHPLRLLDKLCYELDRFTPFIMSSPIYGASHGGYNKVLLNKDCNTVSLCGEADGEEYLTVFKESRMNAYPEFGCNGGASPEYILKYIMDGEDYLDCSPENEVWRAHHAFGAFGANDWLAPAEIRYYCGDIKNTDELLEKSLIIQASVYKTLFEEMRRQWPECSVALNWDLNEPWPCAAGNSLINWPCVEKPALTSVGEALRPTIVSVDVRKNRYRAGEIFSANIWILNDSSLPAESTKITVVLKNGKEEKTIGAFLSPKVPERSNMSFAEISFPITEDFSDRFTVFVFAENRSEWNSEYTFFKR